MHLSSTIIAVASPPGASPRGMIRVDGPDAFELLSTLLEPPPGRTRSAGCARLATGALDLPVIRVVFPRPASYTGHDTVELQMPGNPMLMTRVVDDIIEAGRTRGIDTRRAEPGEFTARAFLNGKMSLTEAEGVAAIVSARSDAELAASRMLTGGRLGELAHTLADELATALSLVEAGIDFTDQDDVVAISPTDLGERVGSLLDRIDGVVRRSVGLEQLRAIPWVVLAGAPNAGKSTLFNTLLGRRRAVVSPTAGTTRDVLAEPLAVGDGEVMLVDLAGLDDADTSLDREMQAAAAETLARAELVLRCVPCDATPAADTPGGTLLVRTRADAGPPPDTGLAVSANTGAGIDALRRAIAETLADRVVSLAADTLALQPRHDAALRDARDHLGEAAELARTDRDRRALRHPELVAAAMRGALDDLAALAGDITPDDVIGRVFAQFCVGK